MTGSKTARSAASSAKRKPLLSSGSRLWIVGKSQQCSCSFLSMVACRNRRGQPVKRRRKTAEILLSRSRARARFNSRALPVTNELPRLWPCGASWNQAVQWWASIAETNRMLSGVRFVEAVNPENLRGSRQISVSVKRCFKCGAWTRNGKHKSLSATSANC